MVRHCTDEHREITLSEDDCNAGYSAIPTRNESKRTSTVLDLPWSTLFMFAGICLVALMNGIQVTAFQPTQLLNLKRLGLASDDNVRLYVTLVSAATGIPILASALLGMLSSQIGAALTLVISCSIVSTAAITMIVARSRTALIIGFLGFGLSYTCRTLRQIFVTEIIQPRCRTEAMSILSFFTPAGSLFGPMIWLLCNRYHGEVQVGYGIVLNKFTLTFFVVACINVFMALTALILHVAKAQVEKNQAHREIIEEEVLIGNYERIQDHGSSKEYSKLHMLAYFCLLQLLASSVVAICSENFQAFLIIYFGVDGTHLGLVFEMIVVAELIPPLIVAFLSRHLKDRTIMLTGFLLKVLGSVLYLPLFSTVNEAQIVVGFALIHKASLFFETALLSLLSIKFDSSSKGTILGIVSSSWSLGYVVAQYSFGVLAIKLFGTVQFAFFVLPLLIALLIIVWPRNWEMLDVKL